MKDAEAGFALLEAIVAAALLSLLFALFAPSMLRMPARAQFQSDMGRAMSVLRTARAVAQASQRDVTVAFHSGRHALVSSAGSSASLHAQTVVDLRTDPARAADAEIIFFASGRSSGGAVDLRRDQLASTLVVNRVNGDVARSR